MLRVPLKCFRNGQTIASYDDNGNILTKADMQSGSTYQYGGKQSACAALNTAAIAGAHAVTSVGSLRYCYDANGNQIATYDGSSKKRSISYSYFDKPVSIDANGLTTFAYDLSRKRYKRETTQEGVTTKTYYVGNVEFVYKNNVFNETRRYLPDAIQTQYATTGVSQTRYLHKDHLGSIDSITDEEGQLVEKLYFDAWGKKQSIDRGQWNINEAFVGMSLGDVLDLTPRGFTGHEHVEHAGVIHMNGRIYDPSLGRFLQADPFIQAPKNSQSYNRYSYVLNSPLSYTDPSGYNFFKSFVKFDGFLAGAFGGGGIVGGAIQSSINHNIHKWVANSQGLTATAGVVIGAFTSWWCGPCSIGFSALFTSNIASYNGASSSEAFHAGGRTAATAGVFYGIGQAFNGQGHAFWETGSAQHIAAHAIAGGIISDLQGGNFGHGFFSAGVSKYAGGKFLPSGGDLSAGEIAYGTVMSGIIGGTASKISGGKFANGARTAAFQYLFNQAAKKWKYSRLEKAYQDRLEMLKGKSFHPTALEAINGGGSCATRMSNAFNRAGYDTLEDAFRNTNHTTVGDGLGNRYIMGAANLANHLSVASDQYLVTDFSSIQGQPVLFIFKIFI